MTKTQMKDIEHIYIYITKKGIYRFMQTSTGPQKYTFTDPDSQFWLCRPARLDPGEAE